ncbi:LLM class flavin-dependent oxidoreductase [Mycobacterium sp. URHB0044]|jgi:probable F420-dependent oxidoreductase|uniref:LLM class flavin-dependent oxidoreductase n=1 Tax=Mycobacterium sp. URHB0044 TaxID=1380386 RepID=UPI000686CBF8|nr:LLM class flavin-dependent oxidoreductase [Mycobacterium sp. URHB0044]
MRVGISLTPDQRQLVTTARWAEEAGFDYLACGEHLFFHGATPNAFVALAAAAGATERIRLLSALTILPVYPPVLAAKLAATLDQVSNGRFDLGVGVGGEYPPEFESVGVPVAERGPRTDEALEVVSRLLSGERLDFRGRWTVVPGLALDPAAVQVPGPPVWVGGRRRAAFRRAGRFADVWMPYLYSPDQLADSLTTVRECAAAAGRSDRVRGAIFCWGSIDRDAAVARRDAVAATSSTYQQDFSGLADRYLVTGTPAQVTSRLLEYRDAGADTVIFAGPRDPVAWRSCMDHLAEEVLPALRESSLPVEREKTEVVK